MKFWKLKHTVILFSGETAKNTYMSFPLYFSLCWNTFTTIVIVNWG